MIVLGVHHGHDSSAALIVDGTIIADVQEERFNRLKHSADFPRKSIEYCLKEGGLNSMKDVDVIAWSGRAIPRKDALILGLSYRKPEVHIKSAIKSLIRKQDAHQEKLPIYFPDMTVSSNVNLFEVEHHLAHAASAYFTAKVKKEYLIFSIDGFGDDVCTSVWMGKENSLKPLQKLGKEASIGWAYSIVTEGLHWIHGDGEGKTMGLAPYGDPEVCKGMLDHLFPVLDGENVKTRTSYGPVDMWMFASSHQWHLEEARSVEELVKKYGKENVAAEVQRKLEEIILSYVEYWINKTGIRNIAFAGGLFLNVKLNQRIWEKRKDLFDEQHIFPNPGDSGLSVGAALYAYYQLNDFSESTFTNLYLGPEFSNENIINTLDNCKIPYTRCKNASKTAAAMLAEGKIIAWFQGRMESGPRALGNRSILMSPLKSENKDIINERVKYREGFRPFCPSLLFENKDDYFVDSRDEPFMITSFDVFDSQANNIPAVVHVDKTARPQMVKKESNQLYWELINEFGKITGHPILLNTSFNVKGEPIVCSPMDAIKCFYTNGLDALFMGDFLIQK